MWGDFEWRTGMKDHIEYHSLNKYRNLWQRVVKIDLGKPDEIDGGKCLLIGIIRNIRVLTDKMMNEMAFTTLKDYHGEIELVFFSRVWLQCKRKIKANKVVALIVNVQIVTSFCKVNSDGRRNFIVCDILNINKLQKQTTR
jgi:DNA polymerase III alpha subunit